MFVLNNIKRPFPDHQDAVVPALKSAGGALPAGALPAAVISNAAAVIASRRPPHVCGHVFAGPEAKLRLPRRDGLHAAPTCSKLSLVIANVGEKQRVALGAGPGLCKGFAQPLNAGGFLFERARAERRRKAVGLRLRAHLTERS